MQLQLKFQLILIYNKAANWTIEEISILVTAAILKGGQGCQTQF
jgi:hypothetical protein